MHSYKDRRQHSCDHTHKERSSRTDPPGSRLRHRACPRARRPARGQQYHNARRLRRGSVSVLSERPIQVSILSSASMMRARQARAPIHQQHSDHLREAARLRQRSNLNPLVALRVVLFTRLQNIFAIPPPNRVQVSPEGHKPKVNAALAHRRHPPPAFCRSVKHLHGPGRGVILSPSREQEISDPSCCVTRQYA